MHIAALDIWMNEWKGTCVYFFFISSVDFLYNLKTGNI